MLTAFLDFCAQLYDSTVVRTIQNTQQHLLVNFRASSYLENSAEVVVWLLYGFPRNLCHQTTISFLDFHAQNLPKKLCWSCCTDFLKIVPPSSKIVPHSCCTDFCLGNCASLLLYGFVEVSRCCPPPHCSEISPLLSLLSQSAHERMNDLFPPFPPLT